MGPASAAQRTRCERSRWAKEGLSLFLDGRDTEGTVLVPRMPSTNSVWSSGVLNGKVLRATQPDQLSWMPGGPRRLLGRPICSPIVGLANRLRPGPHPHRCASGSRTVRCAPPAPDTGQSKHSGQRPRLTRRKGQPVSFPMGDFGGLGRASWRCCDPREWHPIATLRCCCAAAASLLSAPHRVASLVGVSKMVRPWAGVPWRLETWG